MNVAHSVQIDAEPAARAAGRVSDQRRRDFGREFESALSGADGGKEKPETEVNEASGKESLPDQLRGMAGQAGEEVAAKAVTASDAAAGEGSDGPASSDAAKGWNAASSLRLASILALQLGDTPRSGAPASVGVAGQAGLEKVAEALPKTRVDVVAMATHFEPTARDPQLVPGEGTDAIRGATLAAMGDAAGGRLAGLSGDGTSSDRHLAADRDGQGSEKTAKSDAALAAAAAAAGRSAGEGGEPGRRGMGDRNAPAREQAGSPAGNSPDILVAGTPHQAQQSEPLAPASVGGQIAERVSLALAPLAQHPSASHQADATLRFKAGGAALRSIQIQLQPENLGTVDVSMRLVNGELAIELVTSEADTARKLSEDSKALKAVLEKAGFSMDEAAISIVARDHTPARPGQASQTIHSDGQPGFDQARQDGSSAEENSQRRQHAGGGSGGHPAGDAGDVSPPRSERGPSVYI